MASAPPGDPAPTRRQGLERAFARIGLPAWFVVIDLLWIVKPGAFAIDAEHYQRAAATWLAGGDPWSVTQQGVPFASGPHTLLFYAPTNLLPLSIAVGIWMLVGLAAAVWTVRHLGLPIWWLAFPPLLHAVWNGNPQTLMLALLVVGHPVASALSVGLKLYAALPLLFRPRQLLAAAIFLLVTLPLVPWQLYLDVGAGVGSHLVTAWNGSAWRLPILVPPALLALWFLRRRGAEWFSIPTIWPATQFYYVSSALPALVGRPVLAAAFALPVPLLVPLLVIALAARDAFGTRLAERLSPRRVALRRLLTSTPHVAS